MRGGIVGAGVAVLVIGIFLTIFLWPLVALPVFGYYSGPHEVPEDPKKGEVYKCTGLVYDAKTKGDYSVVIIDFNNGESIWWVEKGDFSKGDRVIVQFEVIKTMDESSGEREKMELSEDDKKEIMDEAGQASSDEFEAAYHDNDMKNGLEDSGATAKILKTPDILGLIGIIILILGVVLMIVGGALKSKTARQATQPRRDYYEDRRARDYDYARGPPPRDHRPSPRGRRPPSRDYDYDYDDRYYDDEPPRSRPSRRPPPEPVPAPRGRARDREVGDEEDWEEKTAKRPTIPKFCPECGEKTGGKKFCVNCGEKLIK